MGITVEELRNYIKVMQGMYDVVRLVEPASCHVVKADPAEGALEGEKCYTTWGKCERCTNCTSYQATIRNRVQEKNEVRDGVECHVISLPVPTEKNGIRNNSYCIELVSYGKKASGTRENEILAVTGNNEDALYVSIVGNKRVSDEIISLSLLDSEIGLICFDESGNCIYSNKQAFKMFHIPNELSKMQEFIKDWLIDQYIRNTSGVWSQYYSYEGSEYLYEVHQMVATTEHGNGILGSCIAVMNITDEALNTGGVKFRETHDALTGIYNQEGFYKSVRAAITDNPDEEYYIMCSNIRKFKLINQLFGMEKGDDVLKSIARNLEQWCVKGEIYGRTHSDEFVLFMKKKNFVQDEFVEAVKNVASLLDSSIYRLEFQIGVYQIANVREHIYEMLDKARMAMESIPDGKELTIAFYDDEMLSNTLRENEIINSFHAALDEGQFHIFLQPQVDKNGKLSGGEALARWIHPERGIIPPGMFIGVLENANLIYKMDRYVWELAARQLSLWKGTDKEKYRISVNISPKDLQFLDIEVVFSELADKYQIDPGKLNLEITETAVASNIGNCIEHMDHLRKKGFLVEIDDFGSGYSSLNLLKDFVVDVLKIDMKFLPTSKDHRRAEIILEHIINMAQSLEMVVIAEGVETKEQLQMLCKMGCNLFQGYYFSKPVDIETFEGYDGKIEQ